MLCPFLVQMDPGQNPPTWVLKYVGYNFTGLAGNETMAIETLRKYSVSSCGPPGFYGTIGASLGRRCALALMKNFA